MSPTNCRPAQVIILDLLNIQESDLEPCAGQNGLRIAFEDNFCVELTELDAYTARLSTRLCLLAKNLETQNRQTEKALGMLSELQNELDLPLSLGISRFDNCLRLVYELPVANATSEHVSYDQLVALQFEQFVNLGLAFRKTYLKRH